MGYNVGTGTKWVPTQSNTMEAQMRIEYLVWKSPTSFDVMYDEKKALSRAKRINAGEVEKCTITSGGLIVDSEVIWKKVLVVK